MNTTIRKHKIYKNESDVKDDIKKILDKHGVWYFMPSMNGYGRAGIPDFICCVKGNFMAIEAKFGRGKASAHQARELADIQMNEGISMVINEVRITDLEAYILAIVAMEK